ncbi:MAG: hypothetical protein RIQ56_44 [Candidatus Parcubacteria bacterium]|jgi:hypothetical protein
MFGLTKTELRILKRLHTPQKIQDFLNTLSINFEKNGETLLSPRKVLKERKAHCIEGALLAALALWINGKEPLIMDFATTPDDEFHVIAPFTIHGYWGAISHTNHATLRYRDPIYRTPRELAMSYFHEFIHYTNGKKTLRSYSNPFNMKKLGSSWITSEEDLWNLEKMLDTLPHFDVIPKKNRKLIRPADPIERRIGAITQWKK